MLVAHVLGAEPGMSATLAMAFVAFRVAHAVCYLADWATLRSLSFIGALVCVLWLFFLG